MRYSRCYRYKRLNIDLFFSIIFVLSLYLSEISHAEYNSNSTFVSDGSSRERLRSAQSILKSNPSESRSLASLVYQTAKRENNQGLEAEALTLLGKLFNDEKQWGEAKKHLEAALTLGKALNDHEIVIRSSYNLADTCRFMGDFECAHHAIDSGISAAEESNNKEWILCGHNIRGNIYKSSKDHDKAIDSYLVSLDFAEKYDFQELRARAHKNIATMHSRKGDLKSSLSHNKRALEIIQDIPDFDEALLAKYLEATVSSQRKLGDYSQVAQNAVQLLSIYKRQGNQDATAKFLLQLTIAYRRLGIYDTALEYASELLDLKTASDDVNGIASANNQIAMIYAHLEQTDNAKGFYEQTLAIPVGDVLEKYRASAFRGLASLFTQEQKNQKALDYLYKAKSLYESIKDVRGLESIYRLLGKIQYAQGNVDAAIEAHTLALEQSREMYSRWTEADNLIHIGRLYIEQNPQRAKELIDQGILIARDQSAKSLIIKGFTMLIELEQHQGNYKQAYSHLREKYEMSQDMYKDEVRQRIADLRVTREIDEKERKIALLEKQVKIDMLELEQRSAELDIITKQNTISKLKLEHERVFRILLIFLIFLILVVLVVLYGRFRYTRSMQRVLHENNKQIEAKNKKLEELNATKDRFLSIIAHDLRGPISALTGLIGLLKDDLDNYSQNQIRVHINSASEASEQTLNLVDELLEWAMSQVRQSEPIPRNHEFSPVCLGAIKSVEASAKAKNIRISCDIDKSMTIYADQNMIKTVIRNILSNAIKFTHNGGRINVFATEDKTQVRLHIKDDGVGIKSEYLPQLFDIDKKISSLGTKGEKGSGFGLALCKEFVEKNGGEVQVKSELGEGSEFIVTLPKGE